MVPPDKIRGKELLYKKLVEEQQERDQEQEEKQKQRRNQKDIYLLQRTGLLNLRQESMPNVSTMLFLQ
jgi:hypothetical protein